MDNWGSMYDMMSKWGMMSMGKRCMSDMGNWNLNFMVSKWSMDCKSNWSMDCMGNSSMNGMGNWIMNGIGNWIMNGMGNLIMDCMGNRCMSGSMSNSNWSSVCRNSFD